MKVIVFTKVACMSQLDVLNYFSWWQLGFMLLALIWQFDFPPFMVLIIAILNDGLYCSFFSVCVSFTPPPNKHPIWLVLLLCPGCMHRFFFVFILNRCFLACSSFQNLSLYFPWMLKWITHFFSFFLFLLLKKNGDFLQMILTWYLNCQVPLWQYRKIEWNHLLCQTAGSWPRSLQLESFLVVT